MNHLQEKLLEMLDWLSQYLNEHKLTYYVMGGTMLGAVRHKGFIPWDDDVDIVLPRGDYEKLLELMKTPIKHYVVESVNGEKKDFSYNYAKLYDMNTTLVDPARKPVRRGVYIDIFPLDGIGNSEEESLKNYRRIDFLHAMYVMKRCAVRKGRSWWKNCAVACGSLLPFSDKWVARKLNRACSEQSYENCDYVGYLTSTYRTREIMKKEIYGTPTLYQFENIMVYGPEKYDEYLTKLYGDWRKLPPEDKRYTTHGFIEVDLSKPYMD